MNKKAFSIWYYFILIGIILILGWATLKSLRIIESDVWEEMIPYFGIGSFFLGIAGVIYKFGRKLGRIDENIKQTDNKVNNIFEIKKDVQKMKNNQMNCLTGKLRGSPYSFRAH